MNSRAFCRRFLSLATATTVVVALLGGMVVRAQQPPAQEPKAPEEFKNIQVLKDLPASQLPDTMLFIAASLGLTCEGCHVRTADGELAYERDDKQGKQTARRMIGLVKGLNAEYFKGQPEVTCSTCHQGRRSPVGVTPLAEPFTADELARRAAFTPGVRPPAPKETVDQVIAKYLEALGGASALQKVTAVVMRGTSTDRAGRAAPVVVSEKVPAQYLVTVEGKPTITRGMSGDEAWARYGNAVRDLEGVEARGLARRGIIGLGARLKDGYTRLAVGRYDRIDGHEVIALIGVPSPDVNEALYFDRTSGLLVRRIARLQTPLGRLQVQIDYGDYRQVDAIRLPFEVRVTDWESVAQQRFTDVTLNPALDAAAFARPKAPEK
jgi:hypothetical protein